MRTDVDLSFQPPITVLLPFCRLFFPKKIMETVSKDFVSSVFHVISSSLKLSLK